MTMKVVKEAPNEDDGAMKSALPEKESQCMNDILPKTQGCIFFFPATPHSVW